MIRMHPKQAAPNTLSGRPMATETAAASITLRIWNSTAPSIVRGIPELASAGL